MDYCNILPVWVQQVGFEKNASIGFHWHRQIWAQRAGFQKKTPYEILQPWMSNSRKSLSVPKPAGNYENPWMSNLRKPLSVPKPAGS